MIGLETRSQKMHSSRSAPWSRGDSDSHSAGMQRSCNAIVVVCTARLELEFLDSSTDAHQLVAKLVDHREMLLDR